MSEASGSYVGSLLVFSLTLFLVSIIGTTDVIFHRMRKMLTKESKIKVKSETDNKICKEGRENSAVDFEQDVLSTWL